MLLLPPIIRWTKISIAHGASECSERAGGRIKRKRKLPFGETQIA
jgi:hypothetical protein